MAGFIEGVDRGQASLFPERLDDWIGEDHMVRVVDLFVDELDLVALGFGRSAPEPPPLNWSVPIVRKTENRRWELRDRSLKRLLLS